MEMQEDEVGRNLLKEKKCLKQKIVDSLTELYFLRNNGLMCDFQTWAAKDRYTNLISDTKDDDIIDDDKFSQLLALRLDEPTQDQRLSTVATTAPTSVSTTTVGQTTSVTSSPSVSAPLSAPLSSSSLRHQQTTHTVTTQATTTVGQTTSVTSSPSVSASLSAPLSSPSLRHQQSTHTVTTQATTTVGQTTSVTSSPSVTLSLSAPLTSSSLRHQQSTHSVTTRATTTATSHANIITNTTPASKSSSLPQSPITQSSIDTTNSDERSRTRKRTLSIEVDEETVAIDDELCPPPEKKVCEESLAFQDASKSEFWQDDQSKSHETPEVDVNKTISTKTTEEVSSKPLEESPTRISKVVDPIVAPLSAENQQRLIVERAKHEAAVTARIAELRKKGLWSAKRLPKLQEPPRPKTHWDYLIEEMKWLSTDFDAERKWKRRAAKKCAYMVYRYHQEKRSKIERAEREHLQHIKKLAASQAKEIRSFWSSIEKIVDFRQQTKLEETRKKAWGLHLNYILDQTSKFSDTCMERTNLPAKEKEIEIDYLISQEEDKIEKEPVINNDEQTKSKHEVDDIAAGAESIQPKGNTFETATVSTKVPFLLKHSLREYQHIGLDWLVAMYNKKLNGILADEMGLGKTIQTIALLAHLACEKNEWGPHLIVVPTSVMLNWEMEFKKWCPAFKILTYYGNPKERKMKRVGWSRPNSFHICITSYRIVIQDHAAFRRKKWCYFILDEAHYIKNFKSQRWQMLLNFNSQRRLLLTGTPLQNDLMELWSLMHFLMPNLFDSYREFKDWFVNPLTGMIEGSHEYNQELVARLHKILRPFLLRRLKADVEKQLPRKREFIKTCRLSKRQRFLYEEFMSLSKTKETLASGNFLSVINVLMQLRKVCNHPNLFEPRPTISPFMMGSISYKIPGILTTPLDYDPMSTIDLEALQLLPVNVGSLLTSLACEYITSNFAPLNKFLDECGTDFDSDTTSLIQDDESSITELDESSKIINSEKIAGAYASFKEMKTNERVTRLNFISQLNRFRCQRSSSIYFKDFQDNLELCFLDKMVKTTDERINSFSNGNGRTICSKVSSLRQDPKARLNHLTRLIDEAVRTPEQFVDTLTDIIERFVFCVPGASAPPIDLHVSHHKPSKKLNDIFLRQALYENLSPRLNFMGKIMVNMRTCFPELRLIEYDCGKLQTLSRLLSELKSQDHRVLIFTQMSRMLDILEQFLNYHGHTYLRLDGATKIDQRQILMERFNNDKRIFCFILSTRSGGIGVNLTGADTVIFYDSDWNPTMDAQAQDRCHRIGQTRDVHIYRLISEDTIEKNIFMKAQQKRMLGDLAIEEGNFNTTSFKKHAIQELFNVEPSKEPIEVDKVTEINGRPTELSKAQLNQLEQALSKGEAEAGECIDVDAIKVAKADVDTDLREFDESIPLTEEGSPVEKSEKEQQIDTIVSQMTPVEQYAVKFLESLQKPRNKEELEQAEKEYRMELENKKSQWEQSRIEMLKEQSTQIDVNETLLTYPRGAKCEQVQYLLDGTREVEELPLWAPPTPPTSPPSPVEETSQHHYQPAMTPAMAARINAMGGLGNIFGFGSESKKDVRSYIDEKDVYIDYTTHFFYDNNVMLESQLPPVNQEYTESETTSYTVGSKKIRLTGTPVVPGGYMQGQSQPSHLPQHLNNAPSSLDGLSPVAGQQVCRKPKVRRDEVICLPKSIFDRQTPNFAKIRRELKLQKLRCVTKGNDSDPFAMQKFFHSFSLNPLGQSLQQETIVTQVNRQIQQFNDNRIMLAYQQEQLPPWTIQEEWALLMVLQHLQDLPVNLCILTPGHTPNWELVSEVVSDIGFTNRSFKMCEYHYASTVQKREMTRDSSWDERAIQSSSQTTQAKKSKKLKDQPVGADDSQSSGSKTPSSTAPTISFKPSKTGAMLAVDRSLQLSFNEKFEIIQRIKQNRPKQMTRKRTLTSKPISWQT